MTRFRTRLYVLALAVVFSPIVSFASDQNSGGDSNEAAKKASVSDASSSSNSSSGNSTANASPAVAVKPSGDPLLQLLVAKGVLSSTDVQGLAAAPASELRERLLLLLKDKGILSAADLSSLKAPSSITATATSNANPSLRAEPAVLPSAASTAAVSDEPQSGGSSVVPAIAPIRVLQIDPPKRDGIIPAISIGKNVHLQPYGFVKASVVYDTSSPYGNDFPLPGFNGNTNGPDNLAEFHLKARSTRLGTNFEWLDMSPNIVLTGKFEIDMEGNFSRVNNNNINSINSSSPALRLAYGRLDWHASDDTTLYFLGGQDWTPFGSSTLPNLFETTGLGVGFGTLYQRAPQFRFGVNQKLGGSLGRNWSITPEIALVLPTFGNLPADLDVQAGPQRGTPIPGFEGVANQLGFGERQGADSGRPELQARLVTQFQLDDAPGVAPAQIILSGVNGERDTVVLANQVPAAFAAAFPSGARTTSNRNAWSGEIQLPTRWFTLIGKYYHGSDLREFFAGQIFGDFPATAGLTNIASGQSIDGASTVFFGCFGATSPIPFGQPCSVGGAISVAAKQLPPRSQGGFLNLGLPLSRWFNANPEGHNAGWEFYLHYGYDEVLARDVRREGGGREKGDLFAGTLEYKLNHFMSFVVEESLYRTRALPLTATGLFPAFAGRPMREWHDFRTEIGPLFTF